MTTSTTTSNRQHLADLLIAPVRSRHEQANPLAAYRLDTQIAVITGGGTGLGLAIAQSMAELGARVALVGRRTSVLEEAAAMIGERASIITADVTDSATQNSLYNQVSDIIGPPTVLVNNAGIHLKKSFEQTSTEAFAEVLNTHAISSFAMAREFGKRMQDRKEGSILFISSMAALFGIPMVTAYSAAKTAQLGLVRSLASELSQHNVRVNAIAPGWILTPMSKKALQSDADRLNRVIERTPMRRMGTPEEIGRVAAFLSSPAASFITGAVLPVDGGASVGF